MQQRAWCSGVASMMWRQQMDTVGAGDGDAGEGDEGRTCGHGIVSCDADSDVRDADAV
jgi:hypothetical protein